MPIPQHVQALLHVQGRNRDPRGIHIISQKMCWGSEERDIYTPCPQLFDPLHVYKYNKTEILTSLRIGTELVTAGKGLLKSINTIYEGQVLAFLGFCPLDRWKPVHFCHLEPSVLFVPVSGRKICNC